MIPVDPPPKVKTGVQEVTVALILGTPLASVQRTPLLTVGNADITFAAEA